MFLHSLLVSVAFVPLPVDAKDQVRFPSGPQPTFVIVRAVDGDHVTTLQLSTVVVPITVTKAVIVNGRVENVTETSFRQESRIIERKVALKSATFYNGAGGKLTPEDGRKNLKAGATILLSENGQPLDSTYLRAIRAEALILVTPFTPPQAPAPQAPAPKAPFAPKEDVPPKK